MVIFVFVAYYREEMVIMPFSDYSIPCGFVGLSPSNGVITTIN